MEDEILNALIKRAKGYSYNEVQEEYALKADGGLELTKRKISEKYFPPDSSAFKTYMELCKNDSIEEYSDEKLEEEKERLIAELMEEEGRKSKELKSQQHKQSKTKTVKDVKEYGTQSENDTQCDLRRDYSDVQKENTAEIEKNQ